MRKLIVSILALIATLAGITTANAVTFDGQNFNPAYTEGITEVTFMTDQGIQATVPVWSMEACNEEDGSGQVACVWYARANGNGTGLVSFIKVGGELTATISNEAARILLAQGILPGVEYVEAPVLTEPVQVVSNIEPVVTEPEPIVTEVQTSSTYAPCVNEDGSGQPGNEDCIWVSSQMGNYDGAVSVIWHQGEAGHYGEFLTNEQAESRVL